MVVFIKSFLKKKIRNSPLSRCEKNEKFAGSIRRRLPGAS